ncbi:cytochrome P450 2K1-like isoform X2 [Salvelinus fontinalis]|uniref:cytochrome P450 2K1-like isoform X2 n=1 Tax=Salvelinus fontinalis TaxID=8038 RepID=UPI002486848E|nr:cytochrome P450 2K1-like isoform X2 [Salvelinus fontinalis]
MSLIEGLLQTSSTVTLLGALLFLLALYRLFSGSNSEEQGKAPPGPRPLPLLGNMLQLDLKRPYRTLCKLSKKYGSVFTVHFGPTKVVILAGYKTVKQALVNHAEEFGDRGMLPVFYDFTNGHGKAFDTTQPLSYAVSNIISNIIYGSRFEYSDPKFKATVKRASVNLRIAGSVSIQLYNMFPWLGPWLKSRKLLLKNIENNKKEMEELVRGLKETLNPQMCRGFVDSFLVRKQTLEESGNKNSHYHDKNLISSVGNLFSAGTDTTGNTLRWALMLMAKYPLIQDRVQEEISRVIGSRQPLAEDRMNLPYTDAVIHETQRLASILPIAIPHTTSRDVTFQGYFIKKGTLVFPLLTSVLQDGSEWESPHTFNPAHFLDEEGRFAKRDAFMPFSAGRRVCLGESLARMELFLFFTSLLQRFRFSPPPGVTEDDLDLTPAVGFTLNPSPHQLCAVSRV